MGTTNRDWAVDDKRRSDVGGGTRTEGTTIFPVEGCRGQQGRGVDRPDGCTPGGQGRTGGEDRDGGTVN